MHSKKTKIIVVVALICAVAWAATSFLPEFIAGWTSAAGETLSSDDIEDVEKVTPVGPDFNADSAYFYTQAQCDFGFRYMNSKGHEECLDWIAGKFKQFGCTVHLQKADLKGYDDTTLKSTNIIARYNPQATTRLLFCAHWDSRPWADNDPDPANHRKPILAANDGASGVAVMLELARLLQTTSPSTTNGSKLDLGIDFVCFDAEDWGTPQWADEADTSDSWALGAQYWTENLPKGYAPRYGVLLDMVGGQGAKFYKEGFSQHYAPAVVRRVWRAARQVGYGSMFPNAEGGMITDDHVPVNKGGIACIDVIAYYPDCQQSSFGPTWHTVADDMDHIDKNTLKAVGQTMVQVIYTEK